MRYDDFDAEAFRGTLLRAARAAYNDELEIQAQRKGCSRSARLGNGPILSELNDRAEWAAQSIVNTYNYDLAIAIQHIRSEVPTANRYVYAKRLETWNAARAQWKNPQIALDAEVWARAKAQQDFAQHNGDQGSARLEPATAVCPICQGWIERGVVPLRVAMNHPPPYHVNCPHLWDVDPDKVPREECGLLWMGE